MSKKICPLLKKNCIEHKCAWYTNVTGTHPQTGQEVDKWECSIIFIPLLQMEQTRATRATQAATVEVRNNVEKVAQTAFLAQSVEPVQVKLLTNETN